MEFHVSNKTGNKQMQYFLLEYFQLEMSRGRIHSAKVTKPLAASTQSVGKVTQVQVRDLNQEGIKYRAGFARNPVCGFWLFD